MVATHISRSAPGALAALVVFGLAGESVFGELWRQGPDRTFAISEVPEGDRWEALQTTALADVVF
jgi:hypothetical protein